MWVRVGLAIDEDILNLVDKMNIRENRSWSYAIDTILKSQLDRI